MTDRQVQRRFVLLTARAGSDRIGRPRHRAAHGLAQAARLPVSLVLVVHGAVVVVLEPPIAVAGGLLLMTAALSLRLKAACTEVSA